MLGVESQADRQADLAQFEKLFPAIYRWDEDTTARALSGMAYLNRLRRNDVARHCVASFIQALNGFLDTIESGYANYMRRSAPGATWSRT